MVPVKMIVPYLMKNSLFKNDESWASFSLNSNELSSNNLLETISAWTHHVINEYASVSSTRRSLFGNEPTSTIDYNTDFSSSLRLETITNDFNYSLIIASSSDCNANIYVSSLSGD